MIRLAFALPLAGCLLGPSRPDGPDREWQVKQASEPGPLIAPRLAYDPDDHVVLLYGGAAQDDAGNATINPKMYALGATGGWQPVCPNEPALPMFASGFAYDRTRHRVVVAGGSPDIKLTTITSAVSACDPSTGMWSVVGVLPEPRGYLAMVYDDEHDRLIAIGGMDTPTSNAMSTTQSDDGGATWSADVPTPVAFGSGGVSAIYDHDGHRILAIPEDTAADLTGASALFDDLWQLADGNWSRVCTQCSGHPRVDAALVHVRGTQETYLVDGYGGAGVPLPGTELLDQDAWLDLATLPPSRDSMGVAYDESRDRAVLYGGNGSTCGADPRQDCDATYELVPL